MDTADLIAVARGDAPGDLLFRNARVVNTFTGEIEETSVVVAGRRVAGLGEGYSGQEVVDLAGAYLLPGFINGHTHIESSLLWVGEYARAVVPHGTTTVVTDLHEIANVAGLAGLRAALRASRQTPLDLRLMAPSCVPASPLSPAAAALGPQEVAALSRTQGVIGLGEVMDFPAVIQGHPGVLTKIAAARGAVDGHAPFVRGHRLNAYVAAGMRSDHETTEADEGREKLRRGMYLMIREGTSEKNLETLLPLVNDRTWHRCLFVVDDRSCHDLLADGDIDAIVRKAVALGLDPVRAVQMATIVPATYFGMQDLGAVAPGRRANLIVADDLRHLRPRHVYVDGRLVATDGHPLFGPGTRPPRSLLRTFHVRTLEPADFALPAHGPRYPIIEIIPGQIVTGATVEEVPQSKGQIRTDPARDLLKLAVVDRHSGRTQVGVGLVRGMGLRRGAIASSVAHDAHNIVVAGVTDADLALAANEVARLHGGLVAVAGGQVLASLPLPVGGLMSPDPAAHVERRLQAVEDAARSLGATPASPFGTLAFLALPVIPALKLVPAGLVDAARGELYDFSQLT